jgi:hypothetical protein
MFMATDEPGADAAKNRTLKIKYGRIGVTYLARRPPEPLARQRARTQEQQLDGLKDHLAVYVKDLVRLVVENRGASD